MELKNTEIGDIPNYCQKCKHKYGDREIIGNIMGIPIEGKIIERADARTVCDDCNEVEEIQQAKELNEWSE